MKTSTFLEVSRIKSGSEKYTPLTFYILLNKLQFVKDRFDSDVSAKDSSQVSRNKS